MIANVQKLIFVYLVLLMLGCDNDTCVIDYPEDNQLCLSFNVTTSHSRQLYKDTSLPNSSVVGVMLDGGNSNEYLNYSNLKYTSITVNNKQVWNANMDVILGNDDATLYSYFPWRENINIKSIPIDVTEVNQTDWLYGTPVENINKKNC